MDVPVTADDVRVTEAGLKLEHVRPDGTVSLKDMVPWNPLRLLALAVQLPEVPALTFNVVGVTAMLKSWTAKVIVVLADWSVLGTDAAVFRLYETAGVLDDVDTFIVAVIPLS